MRLYHKLITLMLFCFSALSCYATQWQLDAKNSTIAFVATQNNAPIQGHFSVYKGDINFDPAHLDASTVNITIETGSIAFSYQPITEALKTAQWLDVANFPVATFKASRLINAGGDKYQANGLLMIKGKSLPIEVDFIIEKSHEDKMIAKGKVTIQRLIFGIGQGEWADTSDIKNEVVVDFNLVLEQDAEPKRSAQVKR